MPEFATTAQGSRVATSVGGVLTGRGADIIVIDDPLKPEEALSHSRRWAPQTARSEPLSVMAKRLGVLPWRLGLEHGSALDEFMVSLFDNRSMHLEP